MAVFILFLYIYAISYIAISYSHLGTTGSVQLHGGVVPEAGTVEYCVSGTWKAVCDNSWYYKEAFVVCRQLGFPATGMYHVYTS